MYVDKRYVNVETRVVDDVSEYADELDALVERNAQAYVPWQEYWDESRQQTSVTFLGNYRNAHEDLIVAENESGVLVGFVTVDVNSDRDDIPVPKPFTYLSLLVVDAPFQRKGVATHLFTAVARLLRDMNAPNPVVFGTWSSNTAQSSLAGTLGFAPTRRKHNHRVNGDASIYFQTTVERLVACTQEGERF